MDETGTSGKPTIPIIQAQDTTTKPRAALAATPQTFFIQSNGKGSFYVETNIGVNSVSFVVASITEISGATPVAGDAKMTINNIVPFDNGTVRIRVTIDWSSPLNFWISGFWQ
jgi:hypothetical protein